MLATRVLTAGIALVVFLAALFLLPQTLWACFLLFLLAAGGWEWATLAGWSSAMRYTYVVLLALCAVALVYIVPHLTRASAFVDLTLFVASAIFWIAVAPFWLARRWRLRHPLILGVVGWIALVPMWLAMVRLQATPWALILYMAVVWIADTAAYAAGKTWGRHKLAPLISPGKTWEGAFGALGGVALYFGAVSLLAPPHAAYVNGLLGLALALVMVVLSIEGDLFESWMKRQAGVKDSGRLLPGHGGVLDRIDGLTAALPAAALAYYLH
ncbi:MAG: phosphatidate cytidylyltransferase [Pseudomonadota bacterium]